MLSYQHAYHAGNLADLHKHVLLAWMLDYMTAKPKPLTYMETHAGRGLYDLSGAEAARTGEAAAGIGRDHDFAPAAHPFSRALARIRADHGAGAYPGSPLLAATLLRPDDRMRLAELHPREEAALRALLGRRATIEKRDGVEMAKGAVPPDPARGLCLIDPSYEVKAEFAAMPALLRALHRRWPVGVLVLWYPLLTTGAEAPLTDSLPDKVFLHEVRFPPAREGHRMIGSGLAVINPPFGLADEAARLAARFAALA
ncbi:23S rRNA (adenine(2030)-N(6))-methyltransferase RlmJ [Wenxinia saemankumensis]|uniref:Ribosomal RNA large subunit methyltransferase J n=1 Tax=Wenxinia saemankumensis TaxID=1447782 RepID=A0A1M6CGJ6_9RHOB|nr:23S rRNA (adenine(2030)-N(6))-methyltransferase RlmJ [Wenxinia saemankumensis]SHI60043.1 23S rRNA (adenine2030-N6)-methyltransferase [Wenxinia saemankumensis]